jgi:outer membrane receptor protein involved in Fe transport
MKKYITLSMLLSAVSLNVAHADFLNYSSYQELFGEPVTVGATGTPQRASNVPLNMKIISQEEIRRTPARDIPDLLQYISGMSVWRTNATASNVGMRGANKIMSEKILVLLDGRQVYHEAYGYVNWQDFPVGLDQIKQIEIVVGPNTALYGFNATSGVVNIITYNPMYDDINTASARAGNLNMVETNGSKTFKFKDKFATRVSASSYKSRQFEGAFESTAYQEESIRQKPERSFVAIKNVVQLMPGVQIGADFSRSLYKGNEYVLGATTTHINYRFIASSFYLNAETKFGLTDAKFYRNIDNIKFTTNPTTLAKYNQYSTSSILGGVHAGFANGVNLSYLINPTNAGALQPLYDGYRSTLLPLMLMYQNLIHQPSYTAGGNSQIGHYGVSLGTSAWFSDTTLANYRLGPVRAQIRTNGAGTEIGNDIAWPSSLGAADITATHDFFPTTAGLKPADQLINPKNNLAQFTLSHILKVNATNTLRFMTEYRKDKNNAFSDNMDAKIKYKNVTGSALWSSDVTDKLNVTSAYRFDNLVLRRTGPITPGKYASGTVNDSVGAYVGAANVDTLNALVMTNDNFAKTLKTGSFNLGSIYRFSDFDAVKVFYAKGVDLPSATEWGMQRSAMSMNPVSSTSTFWFPGYILGNPNLKLSKTYDYGLTYERTFTKLRDMNMRTSLFRNFSKNQKRYILPGDPRTNKVLGYPDGTIKYPQTAMGTIFAKRQDQMFALFDNTQNSWSNGGEVEFKGRLNPRFRYGLNYSYAQTNDLPLNVSSGNDYEGSQSNHLANVMFGFDVSERYYIDIFNNYRSNRKEWRDGIEYIINGSIFNNVKIGYKYNDNLEASMTVIAANKNPWNDSKQMKAQRVIFGQLNYKF